MRALSSRLRPLLAGSIALLVVACGSGDTKKGSSIDWQNSKSSKSASPGPIRQVILTHNHIDHSGGASVFVEGGAPLLASQRFEEEFLRQYGLSRRIEQRRIGASEFRFHKTARI